MLSRGPVFKMQGTTQLPPSGNGCAWSLAIPVVASFQRNQLSIWSGPTTPLKARMEECPPGDDYSSIKDDPSKTANPPATLTPSPAGEQAQGEGERLQSAGCCVLSGRVTHMWSHIVCKLLLTLHCCPRSLDPQACPEAMKNCKLPPIPQS